MDQVQSNSFGVQVVLWVAGVIASISLASASLGAETDALSPYDRLWRQISQLLEVREYRAALEVISDGETDPDLKAFKERLEVDRRDIQALQRLPMLVKEHFEKLNAGDPVKIGNVEYRFGRFVADAQGERIIVEAAGNSSPVEKGLNQLDPKSWLALAQSGLSTSAEDRYLVGMFHASVEHGDRKAARQALNLAAEKVPVTHWIARIEAESKARDDARTAKRIEREDPILGLWRVVIGEGDKQKRFNLVLRPDGKTDFRTSTWRKSKDEDYVLSFPNGATARISLGPRGERFKGSMANGTSVVGTRQAKTKK